MSRSKYHLIANSLLALLFYAAGAIPIFSIIQNNWLKGTLLLLLFVASLYFAHKVAPHLTGRLVEKLCAHFGIER